MQQGEHAWVNRLIARPRRARNSVLAVVLAAGVMVLASPAARAQDATDAFLNIRIQLPPGYADPTNAALVYSRGWIATSSKIAEDLQTALSEAEAKLEEEAKAQGKGIEAVPFPKLTPEQASQLAALAPMIAEAIQASRMPDVDWGLEYSRGFGALLPHLGPLRRTARTLRIDAIHLFQQGNSQAAAERIAAMIDTTRQLRNDRILISGLVAVAIGQLALNTTQQALAQGLLTPEARKTILSAIDRLDANDPAAVRRAIVGERDIALGMIAAMAKDKKYLTALVQQAGADQAQARRVRQAFESGDTDAIAKTSGALYDRVLEAWGKPGFDDVLKQIEADAKQSSPLMAMLFPAFEKVAQSDRRYREAIAKTRAALADDAAGNAAPR